MDQNIKYTCCCGHEIIDADIKISSGTKKVLDFFGQEREQYFSKTIFNCPQCHGKLTLNGNKDAEIISRSIWMLHEESERDKERKKNG